MIDFSPFSCSGLKKLIRGRNSTVIVQKGPKLFSLDTIFDYQDFKISVKKLNLERRPDTMFSCNSRVKGRASFELSRFIRSRESKTSFLRSRKMNKSVDEEILPLPNEKLSKNVRLRSSSHHKRQSNFS